MLFAWLGQGASAGDELSHSAGKRDRRREDGGFLCIELDAGRGVLRQERNAVVQLLPWGRAGPGNSLLTRVNRRGCRDRLGRAGAHPDLLLPGGLLLSILGQSRAGPGQDERHLQGG